MHFQINFDCILKNQVKPHSYFKLYLPALTFSNEHLYSFNNQGGDPAYNQEYTYEIGIDGIENFPQSLTIGEEIQAAVFTSPSAKAVIARGEDPATFYAALHEIQAVIQVPQYGSVFI